MSNAVRWNRMLIDALITMDSEDEEMLQRVRNVISHTLDHIHRSATSRSTCTKVVVGSCIFGKDVPIVDAVDLILNKAQIPINLNLFNSVAYGFNAGVVESQNCARDMCHRVKLYGDNSKSHRNSGDCYAIHSEIDAIAQCARKGISTDQSAIFVTRYPCEECAKAIVMSGIKLVVYGRKERISSTTAQMFNDSGITVCHAKWWDAEDNNS